MTLGKLIGRLQAGHVAVDLGLAVLPEREAGEPALFEPQTHAPVGGGVVQEGPGLAVRSGRQLEEEDHFRRAGL